jgi:hypothetical protein
MNHARPSLFYPARSFCRLRQPVPTAFEATEVKLCRSVRKREIGTARKTRPTVCAPKHRRRRNSATVPFTDAPLLIPANQRRGLPPEQNMGLCVGSGGITGRKDPARRDQHAAGDLRGVVIA